ncbi:amino acid adenylation domain-containing protein [Micromonospora sp. WMMD882]|uniref:non-ribosomal peptide synthetase n=1 Tax=Micromonospora sp. WMMD882 TaxID=3015151 RepID=UPI00248C16CC|nr:non-ribosomal peptide synthetase [Micromonospora sp. WMMD882]WBB80949.1 amino acid adenylation domain-containing protein [Micromonospora sp. WMMD882]
MPATPAETDVDGRYGTVTLQPGMLVAHERQPGSGVDILQVAVRWPAPLDPVAMRLAWQRATERHQALRTAFVWPAGGGEPTQQVRPRVDLPVTHHDWSGRPAASQADRLARLLADDRAAGFDSSVAPLVRVTLLTHGPDRHTLAVTLHHAILDGRSVHLLLDEVCAEHDAIVAGRRYDPPARRPFRDYAVWAAARPLDEDRRFWRAHLAGVPLPTPLPLVPLPSTGGPDEPPRTVDSVREVGRTFTTGVTAAVTAAARAAGVPVGTLVTAAWSVLLHRYSGETDVVFGGTRTCRHGTVDGADRMLGLLINTVPVRVRINPDQPVRDWLREVRRRLDELRPHQLAPLARIHRWAGVPARTPLFDSLLMYEHRDLQTALSRSVPGWGDRVARVRRHPGPPVTVCVFGEPRMTVLLYHDRRRLDDAAADAMLRQFEVVLTGLAAGLDRPVAALPLLDATDRALLTRFRAGGDPVPAGTYPAGVTVPDLVTDVARRQPDAVAVTGPDGATLSYRALEERANRLARQLVAAGVRPDEPVGVALPRSVELVVTLLAVLKAGGGYLPLDPGDPPARIRQLLAVAGDPPVLAADDLPGAPRLLRLDQLVRAAAEQPATAPPGRVHPAGLAYVSFTSGSTGVPKGVAVGHGAVVRLVHEPGYLRLGPTETLLQLAPVAFDAATLEIWGALATGARLVVAPPGTPDLAELARLLRRERISVLWLTAGLFHQLVEFDPGCLAGVGQLLAGGDVLAAEAVRRALRARGGAPLVNGYGPTENTTFTCVHPMTDPQAVPDPVPIGRPVPRTTVYVLDAAGRPVPVGVPGELYTGGIGLARGYLGRPAATAAAFLPDPFAPRPGARMYRTGDRVRWRPDGVLEFLGRIDEQVKIRGFRVEPGEVAAVLRDHPAVGDAVVVVDGAGERRRLLGYVTPRPGVTPPTPSELADHVAGRLPAHLRPAVHQVLPVLPLTRNGKVDRRALPLPGRPARPPAAGPSDPVQLRLAAVWAELLGAVPASVDDDFFVLGGNSLLATRLTFAVTDRFGVEIPVRAVYDHPTLAGLAAVIGAGPTAGSRAASAAGVVRRDRAAYRSGPSPTAPAGPPAGPASAGPASDGAASGGPAGPAPDVSASPGSAPAASVSAGGGAGHLVRPEDGPWALWRWIGLRAAGFPVGTLTALGDPDLVAAADAALVAEERLTRARRELAERLRQARTASPPGERARWNRAVRQVRRDAPPEPLPADAASVDGGALTRAHADLCAAYDERDAALTGYRDTYQTAARRRSAALRAAAADPAFREAVTWQNRHALRSGVDALRTSTGGSRHRQHEALVASYLQRYCAKNDTIGFFGPVGWARIADQPTPLAVRHGPTPLAVRTVYFESWAVTEVAGALAVRDPRLRPWLVPRRMPFLAVVDDELRLPLTPPLPLSPLTARLLRACDGVRPAGAIAADLVADPDSDVGDPEEVYRLLAELRDARRITWSLEVSKEDLRPERALRARLAAVDDPAVRGPALAVLDDLERARDEVAAAAGDADRLGDALAGLETRFTALTGTSSTRRAGQVYAGRTLVYEDCRSAVEVTLTPDLVATCWPALGLLLESARWFTSAGAALFRRACAERYRDLAARVGSATVSFADYWLWVNDLLFDPPENLVAPVARGLQDRWARILPEPVDHRITATSAELRDTVRAAFAAPRPGWTGAYQHSPDVLLAATDPDAVARGDYHWVVGEVHPGVNTLRSALFVAQHPAPAELSAAMTADLPQGRLVLAATGEEGGASSRLTDHLVTGRDLRLVFGHDSCGLDPATSVPVADCVLAPEAGVLTVSSRDGRHRLPLAEALGEALMMHLVQRFDIRRPADHQPRITVDRVVLARESWRFAAAGLDVAGLADEDERFRRVRRWQREHHLPRHVFVKSPAEEKPFHLDLASLASVDVFARAVRRAVAADPAATVRLTEMLPTPEQAWLTDARGRPGTAELRLVAVDTRTPAPAGVASTGAANPATDRRPDRPHRNQAGR